jgi:hypothetical protein
MHGGSEAGTVSAFSKPSDTQHLHPTATTDFYLETKTQPASETSLFSFWKVDKVQRKVFHKDELPKVLVRTEAA